MTDEDLLTIISSDGHAGARMADYRPYLDEEFREEFDAFVVEWNLHGSRNFDPPAMQSRMDQETVDEWAEVMADRLDRYTDPVSRLREVEREGVSAEVIFPDFGIPFELYSPSLAVAKGYPPLDEAHRRAAYRAFNRWLADFVSVAPERFAGTALVSWNDVDEAVDEIQRVFASGLKSVLLPAFDETRPLFHPDFEPIWNTIEELGLVVNSHAGMSSTSNRPIFTPGVPHPACSIRLWYPETTFFTHNILSHIIWGGVCERHPKIKFAFTEQMSDWVVPMLLDMDYKYEGSYFRTDYRDVIRHLPSEYFSRQCFLGSSMFSKAEVEARDRIGVDKMMLGMDFPHHEGTLINTTNEYLRATLGVVGVPLTEAKSMLTDNVASVYGFDLAALEPVARRLNVRAADVLTPPETALFSRGDVPKPSILI